MSDRQFHQDMTQEAPGQEPTFAPIPAASVSFRLTADFVVENATAAKFLQRPDLTSEERRLLLTVLTTPEALNRVCRLAIVDDLEVEEAELFEGQFFGPQSEDILAAVMPYLSSEDQTFWTRLQQESLPVNYLTEMFCEFKTALRRVVVVDTTSGETIPLQTRRHQIL